MPKSLGSNLSQPRVALAAVVVKEAVATAGDIEAVDIVDEEKLVHKEELQEVDCEDTSSGKDPSRAIPPSRTNPASSSHNSRNELNGNKTKMHLPNMHMP